MMLGIYIHVPFCLRKCPYCAFYSVKYSRGLKDGYVSAVVRNISAFKSKALSADTVYFGGGTPSLLTPDDIGRIITAVKESFTVPADAEITMEANPCSVTFESICGYKKAGANRISFGVQSANDAELKKLGRLHDFKRAEDCVKWAKEAGIDNISCDLMIGTPNQTLESLADSVNKLIDLDISHISAYMLKIEQGTPYDNEMIRREVADDDLSADMYMELCRLMRERGFDRYEISNFSKPGYESRHNLKYWRLEDYLGFGPSAHSLFEGRRFYVPDDLKSFISHTVQPTLTEDDCPDALEEYILLSLRIASGISLEQIKSLGGSDEAVLKAAKRFISAGLLELNNGIISLTDSGCLVSNGIILAIYDAAVGENL